MSADDQNVPQLPTGLDGFDHLAMGGLPAHRTTLITGTAGSGKTVLAAQILAEGIRKFDQPGVLVTFEESPNDLRNNMQSLGFDITTWEEEGKWVFVDASPSATEEMVVVGTYDFGALITRIEHAVRRIGAQRVAVDSLGAVFSRFTDFSTVRTELFRLASALKDMRVTSVLTAEREADHGPIARFGVEEFVADNVVIMRNQLEEEKRRRTIEILKFRGTSHHKGQFPFTIIPGEGVVVIALAGIELTQRSTDVRVTSGNAELDRMCGGGYFRDSVTLVSGATGTGKTLMVSEFTAGGVAAGERCMVFAYEESREQFFRNASGWGYDFAAMEESGQLLVATAYPEVASLEDHLVRIKTEVEAFRPNRVAVDSLSALERISTERSFREFIIGLTSYVKHQEVAGFFTSTTETLLGGSSITETHISTLTDAIILLRYVELFGEVRRGITVLKMRGSPHEKQIREFVIDGSGMHIQRPFRNVAGILAGQPINVTPEELERVSQLFEEEL